MSIENIILMTKIRFKGPQRALREYMKLVYCQLNEIEFKTEMNANRQWV